MEPSEEPELVELHFELEIDYGHAFQSDQVITTCIAQVMEIDSNAVVFDGVEEFAKDNEYYGLFRGHIPTTKHQIEKLVSIFYHSLQTDVLQKKIMQYSGLPNPPLVEIRELYETDQNDEEDYVDGQSESPASGDVDPRTQGGQYSNEMHMDTVQQTHTTNARERTDNERHSAAPPSDSLDVMLEDMKDMLNSFIEDTDTQFDDLLDQCKQQIDEHL